MDRNKQFEWYITYQFMVFTGPVAVMILAYPYIAYKTLKKRLVGFRSTTAPAPLDASTKKAKSVTLTDAVGGSAQRQHSTNLQSAAVLSGVKLVPKRRSNGFLILSLLTLSMVIA